MPGKARARRLDLIAELAADLDGNPTGRSPGSRRPHTELEQSPGFPAGHLFQEGAGIPGGRRPGGVRSAVGYRTTSFLPGRGGATPNRGTFGSGMIKREAELRARPISRRERARRDGARRVMDREKLRHLHDLTGRVAIVTGGTRGIGLAIAEGFVAAGASVVVASRKADACDRVEQHLRSMGGDALGVPTHMADIESSAALVDRTVETFGRLDIVVNNAANALTLPLGHLTVEAWDKVLATNLRGPVFLVERALPHLESSGNAAVLNVVSAGIFLFSANTAMYAAAKAGLMSMTRSMAAVYAAKGVRSMPSPPGRWIRTWSATIRPRRWSR